MGSAIGISHGLKGLAVVARTSGGVLEQIGRCLPGLELTVGDPLAVRDINTRATRAALAAAGALEKELAGGGLSDARGDDRLSEWGAGRLCPKNRGRIALMEYKQEAIPVPVIFRKKGREI